MFNPGWRSGFDTPIKAPPITRVAMAVTPRFQDPSQLSILQAISMQILGNYEGDISHFVEACRQLTAGRFVEQFCKSAMFGQNECEVTYTVNQGTEIVSIVLFPAVSPMAQAGFTPANFFDIRADFICWPLPGYQSVQGGATGFWVGPQYGNYYYDALFTPLPPSAGADGEDDLDLGLLPELAGMVPFTWWPTGDEPALNNDDVGGSGICSTALTGQQYWEVEVIALPPDGDVPPTITASMSLSGPADASSYTDPTFTQTIPALTTGESGNEVETWSWPTSLDTWLSPVIGLVPECFVDPSAKKNITAFTGVIGLDWDASQNRSIGAVRTSLITGDWNSSDTTTVGGMISTVDGSNSIFEGGSYPVVDPTLTGTQAWNLGDCVGVANQYICVCVDAGTGPKVGPSAGDCASYVALAQPNALQSGSFPVGSGTDGGFFYPPYMVVGGASFIVTADVGVGVWGAMNQSGSYSGGFFSGEIQVGMIGTVTYSAGTPVTTTGSGTKPFGDIFYAPDAIDPTTQLPILSGINTLGRHMPVLKGRGDGLVSALTPSQDADPSGGLIGVWTGIDLGDLQEKDVIMIATDTKTRAVWFGKNKQWYDQNGPSDLKPDQLAPATFMDGADKTDKYYPACSFRFGQLHLRMMFSGSQNYPPPGAFQSYSSPPLGTLTTV